MNPKEKAKEELWCQALRDGHAMNYMALGSSMSPFIRNGSILTIKAGEPIFIGDVILYNIEGGMIAHRVIGKRRTNGELFFITKGDNLRLKDSPVNASELLGKVIKARMGKKNIQMDSFPVRLFNCIIAISSIFILHRILRFARTIRSLIFRTAS